jgi:hypothetical protein
MTSRVSTALSSSAMPASARRISLRSRQGHPLRPATGTHFFWGMTGWGDLDTDRSVPRGPQLWRAKLTAPGERPQGLDQIPVAVCRPQDSLDQGLARERRARLPRARDAAPSPQTLRARLLNTPFPQPASLFLPCLLSIKATLSAVYRASRAQPTLARGADLAGTVPAPRLQAVRAAWLQR